MKYLVESFLLLLIAAVGVKSSKKGDVSLTRAFETSRKVNIFVSFREGTTAVLKSFEQLTFTSRADKLTALTLRLKDHAKASQAQVFKILQEYPHLHIQSFWISNQVYVKDASLELIKRLADVPSVASIDEEVESEIMIPIVESIEPFPSAPKAEEWGVTIIQAPEAWGLDGGNNGEGVVVSTIDTGVRFTHEALMVNYIGEYGWFDPYKFTTEPNDQNGHGTHVTGTLAGQGGIGVAPGSSWMSCKGCASFSCEQDALLSCGQFILCPTNPQGEKEDCSKAPHLVSNSWGGGQGREVFHGMIDAWITAGIVSLFANGNSGPRCGSAGSPGDHPGVIAVGSTTDTDNLSSFSSVGPSVYGGIKPDVSAPGSSIRSASALSDRAYGVLSGTSMACPHAAGVVALLKGRDINLSIDTVKTHFFKGIDREVTPTGQNCGGVSEDIWPNNAFGYGRVNALKSLVSLLEESG